MARKMVSTIPPEASQVNPGLVERELVFTNPEEITITVTWGVERFQPPGSYSPCEIGPFIVTRKLQPNESMQVAFAAEYEQLCIFANRVRETKLADFLAKLKTVR